MAGGSSRANPYDRRGSSSNGRLAAAMQEEVGPTEVSQLYNTDDGFPSSSSSSRRVCWAGVWLGQEELMREEDVHRTTSSFDASVARQQQKFVIHRNPAFEQQQQGFATPNPLQASTRGEGTSADALVVVHTPQPLAVGPDE